MSVGGMVLDEVAVIAIGFLGLVVLVTLGVFGWIALQLGRKRREP